MRPPTRKQKGDLAELKVACDLRRRGYAIAIPFGEESKYDLVIDRDGQLERVQVKYAEQGDRGTIEVRCFSQTVVSGRVRSITPYTRESIDWLAVYEATTDRCFYIPADELGDGKSRLTLRFSPTGNCQKAGIRLAEDYASLDSSVLRFDI